MQTLIAKKIALAIFVLAGFADSALATSNTSHMRVIGYTKQPIGHYDYCKQYRHDCQILSKNRDAIKMSNELWNDLVKINSYTNEKIQPMTDWEAFNSEEVWQYPTSVGDCEDYVLLKRYMLMRRGWPASSLLITVVRQENGEAHAVLTVRTNEADYILDNMTDEILPWNETPYVYLKRQSTKHSGRWSDIADARR